MKKLALGLALACAGLFVGNTANAQDNVASAGVELNLPMGDFADVADFGYGVSVGYELGLSDNFSVLANAGYLLYSTELEDATLSQVPIQLGARYYANEQRSGFYGQAKAGIHLYNVSVDVEGAEDVSETYISAAPEIGYFINENISLGLRYQFIFVPEEETETTIGGVTTTQTTDAQTLSYLGLRAAFNF